jgi:undecaprenyl-diphosphatase
MREIILGFIQGITEFLPISSSGHLVIGQHLISGNQQINEDILLDILLHFATLWVVFIYYRREIVKIIRILFVSLFRGASQSSPTSHTITDDHEKLFQKMPLLILVGSIPTGILGVLIKFSAHVEILFSTLPLVGISLLATGVLLYLSDIRKEADTKKDITILDALIIGTFQGIAVLPGVSRSGATISAGILRGIDRKTAATFSFLLSIPAILGVVILETKDILQLSQTSHLLPYLLGMVIAFISGYVAIATLIRFVVKRQLRWFSWYCWMLGGGVLIYSLITSYPR